MNPLVGTTLPTSPMLIIVANSEGASANRGPSTRPATAEKMVNNRKRMKLTIGKWLRFHVEECMT
jgi:hypothetical protein